VESVRRQVADLGYITNRTTHELASTQALRIKDFVEPRIEPEIIFGLKAAPLPGMSEAALLDCTEWVRARL